MEACRRYRAPDADAFAALAARGSLAGLHFEPLPDFEVLDRYLDTEGAELLRQGLALRLRLHGGTTTATLRHAADDGAARDGVLAYARFREPADADGPPALPPGALADAVAERTASTPLRVLLRVRQRRTPRALYDGERLVGVLALDAVTDETGEEAEGAGHEVEVELVEGGRPADLQRLGAELREFGFEPDPYSKFERGLIRLGAAEDDALYLLPRERAALEALRASGSSVERRRAEVVLLAAEGLPTREISRAAELSPSRVRHWKHAFRRERMGIFDLDAPDPGEADGAESEAAFQVQEVIAVGEEAGGETGGGGDGPPTREAAPAPAEADPPGGAPGDTPSGDEAPAETLTGAGAADDALLDALIAEHPPTPSPPEEPPPAPDLASPITDPVLLDLSAGGDLPPGGFVGAAWVDVAAEPEAGAVPDGEPGPGGDVEVEDEHVDRPVPGVVADVLGASAGALAASSAALIDPAMEAVEVLRAELARIRSALDLLPADPNATDPLGHAAAEAEAQLAQAVALGHALRALPRAEEAAAPLVAVRAVWEERRRSLLDRLREGRVLAAIAEQAEARAGRLREENEAEAPQLRHRLASTLWRRYEAVRAFEGRIAEAGLDAAALREPMEALDATLALVADERAHGARLTAARVRTALGDHLAAQARARLLKEAEQDSRAAEQPVARALLKALRLEAEKGEEQSRRALLPRWRLILSPAFRESLGALAASV